MGKRLEVILGKDGSVRTEVFGAKGPECERMTEPLDNFLGKPTEKTLKDSYNEIEELETKKLVDGLPSGYCG